VLILVDCRLRWRHNSNSDRMVNFPLPPNTFPDLIVSEEDADALVNLSSAFVDDALVEYESFRGQQGGVVDDSRWKLIKTKDGVTVYQDRAVKISKTSTFENDAMVGSMAFSTKLHGLLGVGKLAGTVDDMMYGLLRPTTELMWIKTGYMQDKIADIKVLATLAEPTPEDPMRCMKLLWSVSDYASPVLRRFVRPRDFVYLDSTGFRETTDGKRVGYVVMHSIQVPGIRELTDHQIVRASFSFCGLYRQLDDGHLEFYMKGFVDSAGDLAKSIMIPATAEAMLSFRQAVYCGVMKKLNWALKTQKSVIVDQVGLQCTCCAAKLKPATGGSNDRTCQICMNRSCASCAQQRTLCFYSSAKRCVVMKRMVFCKRCIANALNLSALEIASQDAARQNPFSAFELSSDSNQSGVVSPTDSASIDIQREFFG
jgi:hypothetical protein